MWLKKWVSQTTLAPLHSFVNDIYIIIRDLRERTLSLRKNSPLILPRDARQSVYKSKRKGVRAASYFTYTFPFFFSFFSFKAKYATYSRYECTGNISVDHTVYRRHMGFIRDLRHFGNRNPVVYTMLKSLGERNESPRERKKKNKTRVRSPMSPNRVRHNWFSTCSILTYSTIYMLNFYITMLFKVIIKMKLTLRFNRNHEMEKLI